MCAPRGVCGSSWGISLTLHSFRLLISTFVLLCAAWPQFAFFDWWALRCGGRRCLCPCLRLRLCLRLSLCLCAVDWCHNQYNAYENVFCVVRLSANVLRPLCLWPRRVIASAASIKIMFQFDTLYSFGHCPHLLSVNHKTNKK